MWTDVFTPPEPMMPDSGFVPTQSGFSVVFPILVVLVIAGIVFSIVVGVRKYRVLKDAGIDPFTVDAAVAARVLTSEVLKPATDDAASAHTVEERLAEVDRLFERGVISDDERRHARAAILAS